MSFETCQLHPWNINQKESSHHPLTYPIRRQYKVTVANFTIVLLIYKTLWEFVMFPECVQEIFAW